MSTASEPKKSDRVKKHEELRDAALKQNGGGRSFSQWKAAAVDEVVDLANQAPRMQLLEINLHGDLDLVYGIRMPVPRWPHGDELVIADHAIFHLVYRDEWRVDAPPGWAPLGVFAPLDIFHPNSKPALRGALCLGNLAAGIAPKELILLGYYLASLQDYTLDESDPDGVLNPEACEWYRCHPQYLPLTRAGLFDDWKPEGVA